MTEDDELHVCRPELQQPRPPVAYRAGEKEHNTEAEAKPKHTKPTKRRQKKAKTTFTHIP